MTLKDIELIYNCQPDPAIIVSIDPNHFSIASVNPAFLQLFPVKLSSIKGKNFFDIFPADPSDVAVTMIRQAFKTILSSLKPCKIENYTFESSQENSNDKAGRYWQLEAYPLLRENDTIMYIVLGLTDVTGRVLAEKNLEDCIALGKVTEQQILQEKLRNFDLFNFCPVPLWVYDTDTLKILAANCAAQREYGYTLDEYLDTDVTILLHPAEIERIKSDIDLKVKPGLPNKVSLRLVTKQGKEAVVDLESMSIPSWGEHARIFMAVNITSNKFMSDLEHLEKSILELNAKENVSTIQVLSSYVSGIECLSPEMICSILQVRNNRIYNWVSPSIPAPYISAIEGLEIGANVGSCGTAAFTKREVIVNDIANDPRWTGYKEIALQSNLHACWSYPIFNSKREVIATFGIYYREIKNPGESETKIIERAAALLMVILESKKIKEELEASEKRFKTLINDGGDLISILDDENNYKYISPNSERLLNVKPDVLLGKNVFSFIHEPDRALVMKEYALLDRLKSIKLSPFRYVNGNNELRWAETVVTDLRKDPDIDGIITNSRDITARMEYIQQIEQQNYHLSELKWSQSHLVRAPLARILGIVELLKDPDTDRITFQRLLSYLNLSAAELDKIIQESIKSKVKHEK